MDGLKRLAGGRRGEGRAQARMAVDDRLNGGSQQRDGERSLDPNRAGHVVHRGFRRELVDDPQRFLAVRQRKGARLAGDPLVEESGQQGAPIFRRVVGQWALRVAHGPLSPDANNLSNSAPTWSSESSSIRARTATTSSGAASSGAAVRGIGGTPASICSPRN